MRSAPTIAPSISVPAVAPECGIACLNGPNSGSIRQNAGCAGPDLAEDTHAKANPPRTNPAKARLAREMAKNAQRANEFAYCFFLLLI